MDIKNLQQQLRCFLTAKVVHGKRVFKIVDGTHYPMSKAHIFYEGYTENLGENLDDFLVMGKAIEAYYEQWCIENYYKVIEFYKN